MSKAKVRSMQRGAQKRDNRSPLNLKELYTKHPPQLSSVDKPHIDFIRFGSLDQVRRIQTVVLAADKNGMGTASEISTLLNKLGIPTAVGGNWTPRLVWFAAPAIRANSRKTGDKKNFSSTPNKDAKFEDLIKRVIKSRLEEVREKFNASKPTLGDVSPGLAELMKKIEGR